MHVPMPPHFRVVASELDGPVFADAAGHTLYKWPFKPLRVGVTGDPSGQSQCTDAKMTVNSGFMSPYPPGLQLPDLDSRLSCTQAWPPALASADAEPVGKWTIITRADGHKQWAYEGHALYTSVLDHRPGDVLGADTFGGRQPAMRMPVQPLVRYTLKDLPYRPHAIGRLLRRPSRKFSVYESDRDARGVSNCDQAQACRIPGSRDSGNGVGPCARRLVCVRASSPGVLQWAFRKKPLYPVHARRGGARSLRGQRYTGLAQRLYATGACPPAGFTVQKHFTSGQVLGRCAWQDDLPLFYRRRWRGSKLGCDHPTETQAYRLAMCGGGGCRAHWRIPYRRWRLVRALRRLRSLLHSIWLEGGTYCRSAWCSRWRAAAVAGRTFWRC